MSAEIGRQNQKVLPLMLSYLEGEGGYHAILLVKIYLYLLYSLISLARLASGPSVLLL